MEDIKKGKDALIFGIKDDALKEAEKIIEEARKLDADKRKYSAKKCESIIVDAEKKANEQADITKSKMISNATLEVKKKHMSVRNMVIKDILVSVERKFNSMIIEPEYREVLVDWIAQAAIGLDSDSVTVNASEEELALISDSLMSLVSKKIKTVSGKTKKCLLSKAKPLNLQGVVLTSDDGKTAFNNQVKIRLLRKQRGIQTLIYDELFNEKGLVIDN